MKVQWQISQSRDYLVTKKWKQLSIFVFLIIALGLVREPFLENLLVGEEGGFAFLVANPVPSSKFSTSGQPEILIGNIEGKLEFLAFERTIKPYMIIENVVGEFTRPLRLMEIEDLGVRTRAVRLVFLSIFVAGVAGSLWIAAGSGFLPLLIVSYALTTPLMVGASIQPQLDGSLGVLLMGLAAWMLTSSNRLSLLYLAGLLIGLGRHEWSLSFLTSAVLVFLLTLSNRQSPWHPMGSLIIGIISGITFSLAMSTPDFLNGFQVMRRVAGTVNPMILAYQFSAYLVPAILLIGASLALSIMRLRSVLSIRPSVMVLVLAGGMILAGFSLSGWPGDGFPRYYSPAVILAVYSLIYLVNYNVLPQWIRAVGAVACIGGILWNASFLAMKHMEDISITSSPGVNLTALRQHYRETNSHTLNEGVVLLEGTGFWLYYPNTNFVSEDLGEAYSLNWLRHYRPDLVDRFRSRLK